LGDLTIKPSDIESAEGVKKVELTGAIDAASISQLTNFVDDLYDGGTRWFLVDMRGIKYVNSTGLGSLVKYADQFTERGGGMVLFALPPKVKVIIKMLGLDSFFPIVNSLDDALDEVKGNGKGVTKATAPRPVPAPKPDPAPRRLTHLAPSSPKPAPIVTPSAPSSLGPNNHKGEDVADSTLASKDLVETLLEENRRTNRLLKAVILELRQLRAEFEDDGDD
jgi:anti-sigma B factor antagonist